MSPEVAERPEGCWDRFTRRLIFLALTIVYFVLVPPMILSFVPIYIYRLFASQARKVFRKDLHKLVNTRSSVLSCDPHDSAPCWNLVIWLTQEGILDLNKYKIDFLNDYVKKRKPGSQEYAYPEYQQYYEMWLGFQFWKWDEEFDISNHIRPYDGIYKDRNIVDDQTLIQILKELTWKPWHSKRSPWEFLQISNYTMKNDPTPTVEKSLLIFRIHHGFGDGYYILKLLMQDICGIKLDRAAQPDYVRRNIIEKTFHFLLFWARAPYQFMEMIVAANDVNPWHIPEEKLVRPMNAALTDPIPLTTIKEIKNMHGVSFTAVIYAAISGGIRNSMIAKGVKVPREIHTAVAVPMPNHPPKLRNHFIFSFISLPIGEADSLKRLKVTEKNLKNLKRSTAPRLNFVKVPLAGALPKCMMKPFTFNYLTTCLMSNFPGTPEIPNFKGVNVLDMMFTAGLGQGNTSLGFCMTSCVNHFRMISTADPNVLSTDREVEELNERIVQELEILRTLGSV